MSKMNMKELSALMKKIDFCHFITTDGRGTHHSRPMSNNKNVEYDGTSYFFSLTDTGKVRQIEQNSMVSLAYQGDDMLFVHVYGKATFITQRGRMEPLWDDGLNGWFKEGLDTPGLVLIRVDAHKICYWHKEKEGVIEP